MMKHNYDVLLRTIAAIIGGYCVSLTFTFTLVPVLVEFKACEKNEAVMVASMLSYVVYFSVIIISFSRKNSWLLWRDITLTICILSSTYWLMDIT
jgi:hypothetical protein